jgi:hypothetical protein
MAHYTNFAMQTFTGLLLVVCLENMLQTLHSYFAHSPKRHLEFTKLTKFMQTKGDKIFQNVKTMWMLMFNLAKMVMVEYKNFVGEHGIGLPYSASQVEL